MYGFCGNSRDEVSRVVTFADAKNRFSNRVADYLRYRPHYPEGVLDFLRSQCHLSVAHTIADVASGTGFLSELFLKNGNPVFGVEPNQEMRAAGEEYLAAYPRFTSIDGSAEATTLPDSGVDFVTVGQAFHWFKPEPTRREFTRILRPNGWVAIVWNDRTLSTTGFAVSYEALLVRFGTDYARVKDSYPQVEGIRAFFGHEKFLTHQLPNSQQFDLESLRGRLRSSSYVPTEGDPNFAPMMAALDSLFATHQENGRVLMEFSTWVHVGQLTLGSSLS
jgi:SAM-dependent methyltransferase